MDLNQILSGTVKPNGLPPQESILNAMPSIKSGLKVRIKDEEERVVSIDISLLH